MVKIDVFNFNLKKAERPKRCIKIAETVKSLSLRRAFHTDLQICVEALYPVNPLN